MKTPSRRVVVLGGLIGTAVWYHYHIPEPTILAFRIGDTIEEVARNSTFPVMEKSNKPEDDPGTPKFGVTWVTEPAVIIHFNDPEHGFTLPPTKFAALSYMHYKASTLATSPMLDTEPWDEALAKLEDLQNQLKAGGWEPYKGDGSEWFDLSPEGKTRLYMDMFDGNYERETSLRVRNKYAITFSISCMEGCWTLEPPYRFIINVGVSDDTYARLEKIKEAADDQSPGAQPDADEDTGQ